MAQAEATIRVMLVDDHRTMLWGLEKLIGAAQSGMQVVATARSCAEALEKIGQVVPDVILLDLDLNGESALDILPALLANAVSRVLVLTGERQQAILDRAVLSGVRGLLRKDASAELVLKAIEKVHQGELWLDQSTLARVVGGLIAPPAPARAMPDPERAKQAALTGREREIIGRVVAESGAMNKVLARQLFISEHTLRNHLTSIYQKLEVGNRLELYFYAVKHKLGTTS